MLKKLTRPFILTVSAAGAAVLLSACAPMPPQGHQVPPFQPPVGMPGQQPGYVAPPVFTEFGRVVNIETFEGHTSGQGGTGLGTVAGGVIGGALGNQVGRGRGRTAATAAGVVGGAVAGNVLENRSVGPRPFRVTRVTVQTDNGNYRIFDVPDSGDLQVGHRVRIEGGQLFRM